MSRLSRQAAKCRHGDVVQKITSFLRCQMEIINIFYVLNMLQSLVDVVEQIGLGFEPGGETHERVADPELGPCLRLEPRMGRGRRVSDETLRVAEIVRYIDEPQRVEKAEASRLIAGE